MSLPRLFLNRVSVETKKLSQDLPPEITCWPEEEDKIGNFRAVMKGPLDSPYAGGIFTLRIVLPQRYPHEPPKVNFLTRIYHPNVDDKGRICLDILKSLPKGTWTSGQNIMSTLMSIYSLLSNPNADDPLDIEAATLFKNDRLLFNETVKKITKLHATGEDTEKNLGDDLESTPLESKENETSVKRQKPVFSLKKGKNSDVKPDKEVSSIATNDSNSSKVSSTPSIPKKQTPKIFSLKKLKENKKDSSPTEPSLPEKDSTSCSNSSSKKPSLPSSQVVSNQSPPKNVNKRPATSEPKTPPSGLKKKPCHNVSSNTASPNNSEQDACGISRNKNNKTHKSTDYLDSQIDKTSVPKDSSENKPASEPKNSKPNRILKKVPKKNDNVDKAVLDENSPDKVNGAKGSDILMTKISSEKKVLQSVILNGDENHLKSAKKSKLNNAFKDSTDTSLKKDTSNDSNSSVKTEMPVPFTKAHINSNSDQCNAQKSITITSVHFPSKNSIEEKPEKMLKTDSIPRKNKPIVVLSSGENSPLQSISPSLPKKPKVISKAIHRLPTPNLDGPPHPMKAIYDACKSTSPGSVIQHRSTNSKSKENKKIKSVSLDEETVSSKQNGLSSMTIGNDLLKSNESKTAISSDISEKPPTEHHNPEIKHSHLPIICLSSSKNVPLSSSDECLNTEEVSRVGKRLQPEDNVSVERKRGWRPSPLRPTGKMVQDGSGHTRRPTFSLKKLRKN